MIRDINDPEHPLTLEQLNVVTEEQIAIDADKHDIKVMFTPTIPHCSMATPTPPRVPERGARQQQQQLSTPPGDLSEEGWRQIDDIANVFMRNIYNQSIRVTTSLHRLKKLKSGSVKEKEAFKNIMNKIFLDLTLIGTFDREKIIILAQLLSGIININFTIPHCSMATLIGLAIRVKLLRSLPDRFKVSVSISPGTHASEAAINKQLADKERVAAALENGHLLQVVNQCLDVTSRQD